MSQRNSVESKGVQPSVELQKQQLNVYTVMLVLALISIFMSILLLYLELRQWGSAPWWKTSGSATSSVGRTEATPWYAALPAPPTDAMRCA